MRINAIKKLLKIPCGFCKKRVWSALFLGRVARAELPSDARKHFAKRYFF